MQRPGREAEVEDPVEEAQLEGAVVPDAVAAVVRHGVDGHQGGEVGRVGEGQRVLRAAGVGRAHGADAALEPGLLADPGGGVEAVLAVVPVRSPPPFGGVAPAHVLAHEHVAEGHEALGGVLGLVLVVGRALEHGRESPGSGDAVLRGQPYVGGQAHPVAHGDHDVAEEDDLEGAFGRAGGRGGGEDGEREEPGEGGETERGVGAAGHGQDLRNRSLVRTVHEVRLIFLMNSPTWSQLNPPAATRPGGFDSTRPFAPCLFQTVTGRSTAPGRIIRSEDPEVS